MATKKRTTKKKTPRKRSSASNTRKKKTALKSRKPAKAKRASGIDLAADVLRKSKQPLNAKEITERVIKAGWKTKGATPHATLYSAMVREIDTKGKEARFVKAGRGQFTLRKGA